MNKIKDWFKAHETQLWKRVKSFIWRETVLLVIYWLDVLVEFLNGKHIDWKMLLLGTLVLVINETTKYLNNGKHDPMIGEEFSQK